MTQRIYTIFILTLNLLFFGCSKQHENQSGPNAHDDEEKLFSLLSPQQTGIYFKNTLAEGPNTNILMYEYFYNGAGVATGDLNGDGLEDIYFSSNMEENKLYLNKGQLHFDDITAISKVTGRPGPWKTGVTMVDINGDNKLDIYLCYSGALPDQKRKNQLFINQGNDPDNIPIFKEMGDEFGLSSAAYSNQAYFFDFDRDGDLDVLLLNHNPKSLPILDVQGNKELLQKDNPYIGLRLYEQENGVFNDITNSARINGSHLSYGLGLAISDLNNDQWPDFYVCNDYSVPDYLYINNQDGTFKNVINEGVRHTSLSSMGNDAADINNDGWADIITMDMLPEDNLRQKTLLPSDSYEKFDLNVQSGFHHQFMRNMLQLNNGNGTFSEIGQLAGISNTDWSWSSLLADFDNDGWKDLYISNGYYKDFTDMDFLNYMNNYVKQKGRLKRDNVMEIVNHLPSANVLNYMYRGKDGMTFEDVTKTWGLDHPAKSIGVAYSDLDNDGDLDLVVNNTNKTAFIYQNNTIENSSKNFLTVKLEGKDKNTQAVGARVLVIANGQKQMVEQYSARGYLSAVTPTLHFGLDNLKKVDSLIVNWPDGTSQLLTNVSTNQLLTIKQKEIEQFELKHKIIRPIFKQVDKLFSYSHPKRKGRDFRRQPMLIKELSNEGPCMAKGDINGDGLEDIIIGGDVGQSTKIFVQQAGVRFNLFQTNAFENDKKSVDTDIVIFDANSDGYNDLYIASGGYHTFQEKDPLLQDRLYFNDGKGNFTKNYNALPEMLTSTGCVAVSDFNGDSFEDIFIGGRMIPGNYPTIPESYLLINDGNGHFENKIEEIASELENIGLVTDALWTDVNLDGKQDLMVVGEWMPVSIFTSENGKLINSTSNILGDELIGWWNTIESADFNKDNRPDFIVGNMGLNTQIRVIKDEPAELYYNDFDNSGSLDLFFCYYINGQSYPYVTRDELIQQLPVMGSKFPTYADYGEATMENIFEPMELEKSGRLILNHMKTTLLLSNESGGYSEMTLPIQAQFAPVYSIQVMDYNDDQNQDVLLLGNDSYLKLRLGSIDANYGMLFKGDGKGSFEYIDQIQSGLTINGDVRSSKLVKDRVILGINQNDILTFKLNR